jgi:hypothetical protein
MYHRSRPIVFVLALFFAFGPWILPNQAQPSPQSERPGSAALSNGPGQVVRPKRRLKAGDTTFEGTPGSGEHKSFQATDVGVEQAVEVDRGAEDGGAQNSGTTGVATTAAEDQHIEATGLVINATFDGSITGNANSAAIQAMINQAIRIYGSLFKDPVTVSILFRYSTTSPDGTPLSGGTLAQSNFVIYTVPWNTFVSALIADAKTANDATANSSLPAMPLSTNVIPSSADGRALGLNTPAAMFADGTVGPGGPFDGIVTLNSAKSFQFTRPPAANNFDARRSTEHEIDEVLGLGSFVNDGTTDVHPQDLFSWSSAGTRNLTSTGTRYFSINGGITNIVGFNQTSGGDLGDWVSPACPQANPYVQNAFSCPGQMSDVLATSPEGINLDVIGYDLMASTPGTDTAGLYDPGHAAFFLRNSNSGGIADISFTYGPTGLGFIPLVGDWNGDGVDTIGLYDPAHAAFFLRNSNTGGIADISFTYGPAGLGFIPLVGDWNGDGVDTVGLYDPAHAAFFLRNSNTGGIADISFTYGPAGLGFVPIVGDWNGDGIDTIGLYDPSHAAFFLRNSNSGGIADITFTYGPAGSGLIPLVGDWNADGIDSIGLYNPATAAFFLRNSNTGGIADISFTYGPAGMGFKPLTGDWDGL